MIQAEQRGFRALSDPTRRGILHLLAEQDLTIAEVADNFQMTRAAVKKHLTVLQEGDLITTRTDGRTRVNALNPDGLKRVHDWFSYFDAFWDDRLATLKTEIEKDEP
jgi:DNA-binding transcriptional ArsR family regulator